MHSLTDLHYARARFTLTPSAPTTLPPFLGSTLRGALGHALRAITGDDRRTDVERRALADTCPYLSVFGDPAVEAPGKSRVRGFVLRPPPIDDAPWTPERPLDFAVTLLGRAHTAFPAVVVAVSRMARDGLGVDRAPFELTAVTDVDGEALWMPDGPVRPPRVEQGADLRGRGPDQVTIDLASPLGLAEGRDLVPVTPAALLRGAFRRLVKVLGDCCDGQAHPKEGRWVRAIAPEIRVLDADLQPYAVRRHSNRQKRQQTWPAWRGHLTLQGQAVAELAPLLRAAEVLHVGRKTAFGLGALDLR